MMQHAIDVRSNLIAATRERPMHFIARICWISVVTLLPVCLCRAQSVVDPDLRVQTYATGLDRPTGVVFLNGSGDALVTQKDDGRVLFMRNRRVAGTALDLPVANDSERGLLGIALSPGFARDRRVYLYHTVAGADGGSSTANRISRYRWDGSRLVFDRNIIDLPGGPGPNHDGGKLLFDTKGKLYAVIGDLNRRERTSNFEDSSTTNNVAAIIRIQPNGGTIQTNPFASVPGARNVFAYGIRNSFGIAIDPVTGVLWDTENGSSSFDEINRVTAGFNSGWRDIMGPRSRNGGTTGTLTEFNSRSAYSDPEFSWAETVAPTDLHFLDSSRLGADYRNDLFVGDVNTGSLYHFELTANRRALQLDGDLADLVADNSGNRLAEQDQIIFGSGFGVVTDILNGPGGMFVLSLSQGKLYRITTQPAPASSGAASAMSLRQTIVPEPSNCPMLLLLLMLLASVIELPRRCTAAARRGRVCRTVSS
jgi:glucose/arabinose dehydrogenase